MAEYEDEEEYEPMEEEPMEEELPDAEGPPEEGGDDQEGDDEFVPVPGELDPAPPLVPLDPNQEVPAPVWAQPPPGQEFQIQILPPVVEVQVEAQGAMGIQGAAGQHVMPLVPGEIAAMNPADVAHQAEASKMRLPGYLKRLKGKVVYDVKLKAEEKWEHPNAAAVARESDRLNFLRSPALSEMSEVEQNAATELLLALSDVRNLPMKQKQRVLERIVGNFSKYVHPLKLDLHRNLGWSNVHLMWCSGTIDSQKAEFFRLSAKMVPYDHVSQEQVGRLDHSDEQFQILEIRIYPTREEDIEQFRDMANIIEISECYADTPVKKAYRHTYHPGSSNLLSPGTLPMPILPRNQAKSATIREYLGRRPFLRAQPGKSVITGLDVFHFELRTMLTNHFHGMDLYCVLLGKYYGDLNNEVE
jgi:hypothetical protein